MKNLSTFIAKEMRAYFYSPIAYIIAGVFLGLVGYFFYSSLQLFSIQSVQLSGSAKEVAGFNPTNVIMKGIFRSMGTVFILLTPLLTMRLIADERRMRTMELLMTSPLTLTTILAGKFLAALAIYHIMIGSTLYVPLALDFFSTVSWAHVTTGYLGLSLLGAAMLAVGLFCSALTDKQIIAAVLNIGILVFFWFIGGGIGGYTENMTSLLKELSLFSHFERLYNGLLDSRDLVYLLSVTAAFLFLAHRVLDSDRWR